MKSKKIKKITKAMLAASLVATGLTSFAVRALPTNALSVPDVFNDASIEQSCVDIDADLDLEMGLAQASTFEYRFDKGIDREFSRDILEGGRYEGHNRGSNNNFDRMSNNRSGEYGKAAGSRVG